MTSTKLSEVVEEYDSLGFQVGSIELCLTCASAWDSDQRGLSFWRDGCPRNDGRSLSWEARNFCYSKALEALQTADDRLDAAVQSSSSSGGPSGNGAGSSSSIGEAESIRQNARQRALSTPDEAFHHRFYQWHLDRGLTDQLLDVRAPHLEFFLLQEPMTLERFDLLWQYYARHYQHIKAAHILARLSESTEFPLPLEKRLEYLSLASSNAKAQFPDPAMRQDIITFLTEIDEKLEVGAVQVEVFRTIEQLGDLEERQKDVFLKKLQERLFSVTEVSLTLFSDQSRQASSRVESFSNASVWN